MTDIAQQTYDSGTTSAALPADRSVGGALAMTLRALTRWWSVGRHYRPERRYMRGGGARAATR